MKTKQILITCGIVAALFLSVGSLLAQNNNDGNGGGRNFDPAQFQQRIMDNIRDQLDFTNDADWDAVQPLVQKVIDARRDVGFGGIGRGLFGGRRGGNDNGNNSGGRRGFGPPPSPEAEALQKAIDDNAPPAQIQTALDKYRSTQQAKEDKLHQAQEDLRKVLTVKQEAQATLLGLLN
jgi:hypothetical protein